MKNIQTENNTVNYNDIIDYEQYENKITKFLDRKLDFFKTKAQHNPVEERIIKNCLTVEGYDYYYRWMDYVNSNLILLPFKYEEICMLILHCGLKPFVDFCKEVDCSEYKLSINPKSEFEVLASDAFQFNCEMELISHIELIILKEKFKNSKLEDSYEI